MLPSPLFLPPRCRVTCYVSVSFWGGAMYHACASVRKAIANSTVYGWMCHPFQQRRKHLDLQRQSLPVPLVSGRARGREMGFLPLKRLHPVRRGGDETCPKRQRHASSAIVSWFSAATSPCLCSASPKANPNAKFIQIDPTSLAVKTSSGVYHVVCRLIAVACEDYAATSLVWPWNASAKANVATPELKYT